jgi:hypothetical protein
LAFVLLGCEKDPIGKSSTNNPDVTVSLLFEHEGVKVYRFYDNGHAVYYTDARGRTSWQQNQGKTSSPRSVETVGNDK